MVSVYYADVPADLNGGELMVLDASLDQLATQQVRGTETAPILKRVCPTPDTLVNFAGNLVHGVNKFDASVKRISIVCEQYKLKRRQIMRLPKFNIFNQMTNEDVAVC